MTNQVRNIDADIQKYKDDISLRDALVRLEKNRDFKKVFETAYFKDFAQNLVAQRALPEMRSREELIAANTRKLDAISEAQHFIRAVHAMGGQADGKLSNAEVERDVILAEQDEE
ncbi:coil containing protein [Vibrio phage 1.238.A._10N.261.52.F10]|uniref:Coil containing protein n=2 Tax=Pariacacavirus TaxID=2948856 RepID=A0A2I7RUE9_9CAUD|nr:coil containing protein [Vibrio phage 1.238.A._10N.261.52.F10]YP_010093478.1 hypothetical protein KNT80_gp35 [Vibrio phage 1.245.O._10N.261.54.C7]AUR97280.1 coil containing protein [Vibrio phage 1.238.A._10N.261.52.F10]AUR97374.1 coil containing protein [Vibrio phage 1.238.B._10N.261.52.F10]AUR97948.1 hypothetical protein NVP1245O_35 [Vibrio phage 1.245.O._10N.261.54.C7]